MGFFLYLKHVIICPCPLKSSILWHRSKGIKRSAHAKPQKKRAHILLASSQANALRIYYLRAALYFQRTAVDLKQLINTQSQQAFSSGPDTDYRCHETGNLITSTLSFDAISRLQFRANTWLWHLCSSGLSRDGNCHFVGMIALEAPVWGKRQITGNWDSNLMTFLHIVTRSNSTVVKCLVFCMFIWSKSQISTNIKPLHW